MNFHLLFDSGQAHIALDAPVKLVVVKVRNRSGRTRRLSVAGYWELVLGQCRHANLMHVVSEIDPNTGSLFAANRYTREFAGKTVFVNVSEATRTMTGSRTEFIGRNGTLASPAAMRQLHLSGRTGAGLDPCAALQVQFELADGQERDGGHPSGLAAEHHPHRQEREEGHEEGHEQEGQSHSIAHRMR